MATAGLDHPDAARAGEQLGQAQGRLGQEVERESRGVIVFVEARAIPGEVTKGRGGGGKVLCRTLWA